MSLQIRRGTAAQLANITPVIGELIYTTDTQAVFVGDGSTLGGIPVAVGGSGNVSGTNLLTLGIASAAGNVYGNNIIASGFVSAVGNVTGNYVLGNGSLLTGVVTSATAITNGTSNVAIGASNGNATISINGTSNVVVISNTRVAVSGLVSATGNITGNYVLGNGSQLTGVVATSIGVLPSLSVSGNIISGNVNILGSQTVIGNVVGGNINTAGNVTGAFVLGNGSALTGVTAVAVGTLTSLSVTGNIDAGNLRTAGSITSTGNITGGNVLTGGLLSTSANVVGGNIRTTGLITATGNISGDYLRATNDIDIGGNITATGFTGALVSVTGNITGGNVRTAGLITATGNITGGNLIASTSVSTTGNVTGGNILSPGIISSTGNGIHGNIFTAGVVSATGNIVGSYFIGNGSALTGLPSAYTNADVVTLLSAFGSNTMSTTGNVTSGNFSTDGFVTATGNVTGGNIRTAGSITATGNIITAGILTVNSGNAVTAIVNGGGNSVGNIGSSSKYFNTVFATATTALYADLAECYTADADYEPGTVVMFGGPAEVTKCDINMCVSVAGVISTNPAYLMNSGLTDEHVAEVALTGRVPCKVQGPVKKGSMMVSAGDGRARAEINPAMGSVLGKAVESFDGEFGTIEIAVGRL
jgi:hypothetical protein